MRAAVELLKRSDTIHQVPPEVKAGVADRRPGLYSLANTFCLAVAERRSAAT
jgi:hypothetical protein